MKQLASDVEKWNSLLRGELSSLETYRQAIEKVHDSEWSSKLQQIQMDHQAAVDQLKRKVIAEGGIPSDSSGPWGVWAKTVTGIATVISESAVVKTLKEGEEHGVKEYRSAMEEGSIDEFSRQFLSQRLERQSEHIRVLDGFLAAA